MAENTKNTIFGFTFGIGRYFFTDGSVFYRSFGNRPKVKNPPSVGHYSLGYSGVPNNRTYVRSCSEKIFPLCTQLLETLYAQSREAKFFKINDLIKNKRLFCLKKLIFHLQIWNLCMHC